MSGARAVIKSSTMVQDELEEAIKVSTMALHSYEFRAGGRGADQTDFRAADEQDVALFSGAELRVLCDLRVEELRVFLHRAAGRLLVLHGLGLSVAASRRPRFAGSGMATLTSRGRRRK